MTTTQQAAQRLIDVEIFQDGGGLVYVYERTDDPQTTDGWARPRWNGMYLLGTLRCTPYGHEIVGPWRGMASSEGQQRAIADLVRSGLCAGRIPASDGRYPV